MLGRSPLGGPGSCLGDVQSSRVVVDCTFGACAAGGAVLLAGLELSFLVLLCPPCSLALRAPVMVLLASIWVADGITQQADILHLLSPAEALTATAASLGVLVWS